MTTKSPTSADYDRIHRLFETSIGRKDCGKHCAPINGGEPVCCDTAHAVPVAHVSEWRLLRDRTDLWRRFKPDDAAGRQIVDELTTHCVAIECKGARFCERENRTLACRSFPFFPYLTRAGEFIGLGYYWDFEDRCWVLSNLGTVEKDFVREFAAAYEALFAVDREEYDNFREHSANMRRVFTRWRRVIPLIGRDGGYLKVMPRTAAIRPATLDDFRRHGPYRSEAAYKRAVAESEASKYAPPKLVD
jgi:hypothetical protein